MKNRVPLFINTLTLTFVFGMSLMAQEKTEVTLQVKKDGKVVKDTTYQFEDEAEAKHAIHMMEALSGEEKHLDHFNYTMAHSGDGHSNAMVFISEDGKTTKIKHLDGDSLVWISEEDHPHGKHVVVVKSGDGETFDIMVDEDEDGNKIVTKELKVIVSGDQEGTWHVDSDGLHEMDKKVIISDDDENVFIIKGDGEDVDVEIEEILKEHGDGENVKVIVIKKEGEPGKDADDQADKVVKKKK